MAPAVMKATMVVRNPATFEAVVILAGEEVPAWARPLVHDDDVIEQGKRTTRSPKSD